MKKLLFGILPFAFMGIMVVFGISLAPNPRNAAAASAATGTCYFGGGSCSSNDPPSIGGNDVLSGSTAVACGKSWCRSGSALSSGDYDTVAHFISHIEALYDSGSTQDKVGAAYLMNLVVQAGTGGGNPAVDSSPTSGSTVRNQFEARLKQAGIALVINTSMDLSESSFYDIGNKDDFLDTNYTSTNRQVLIIQLNGVDQMYIETACGNYSGGVGVPLPPSATLTLEGIPSAATVYPGASVTFTNKVTVSNSLNTGGNSFDWKTTNTGLPAAANTSGLNVSLNGNRVAVRSTYTWTAGAPGTYCRNISVSGFPSWVVVDKTGSNGCVTVLTPSITCSLSVSPASPMDWNSAVTLTGSVSGTDVRVSSGFSPTSSTGPWLNDSPIISIDQYHFTASSPGAHTAYMKVNGKYSSGLCQAAYSVRNAPFKAVPSVTVSGITVKTVPGSTNLYVASGDTITVNGYIHNDGPNAAPIIASTLAIASNSGITVQAGKFSNTINTDINIPAYQDWVPNYHKVTTTVTGANGSHMCFSHSIYPSDQYDATAVSYDDGQVPPALACIYIYVSSGPNIVTQGSDVHAGSNCGAGTISGLVVNSISTNSKSYNQYLVTTINAIGGFGSNNTILGTRTSGQGYAAICRPDLFGLAKVRFAYDSPPANPLVLDTAIPGGGVRHYSGSVNLGASTFSQKTTLVIDGDLTISGDVNISSVLAPVTRATAPSLGVIVHGNINIMPNVKHIDAYLFADGIINTCSGASSINIQPCGNQLVINGFLMSHRVQLNRTGMGLPLPVVPLPNPVGEIINMTGQIYINPPSGFDIPGTFNFLQLIGERPPLN